MKIFKFGGGILSDAGAIRQIPEVLKHYPKTRMVIIISAFGKTTNALEKFIHAKYDRREKEAKEILKEIYDYHFSILNDLWNDYNHVAYKDAEKILHQLYVHAEGSQKMSYDQYYDTLICFGELLSSTITHHYLNQSGYENYWLDARELILTDSHFRNATVDFAESKIRVSKRLELLSPSSSKGPQIFLTQGFIGADADKHPSSLGREGSDYTASIFGNILDAEEVIIWKDVPGVLNADPRHFSPTVKIEHLSYSEATELAYYGAKVMHPKTVKPLQNKKIPLRVKPFWEPLESGSLIHTLTDHDNRTASFIFKFDQVLISVSTPDLSFINETTYHEVFGIVSRLSMHVNITQNSALTLSFCVDNHRNLPVLIQELQGKYQLRYNEGLQLITIRHYSNGSKDEVLGGRQVLLEQQSRTVLQMVVR